MFRLTLLLTLITSPLFAADNNELDRLQRYLKMAKAGRITGELQKQVVADLEAKINKEKGSKLFTIKNGKIIYNKQIFTGKDRTQLKGPPQPEVNEENEVVIGVAGEVTANYGSAK